MPFMQCSGQDVCRHGVRTDKSFWLAIDKDAELKPMNNEQEIQTYISRCSVCMGTSLPIARHSFDENAPVCPDDFYELWQGYSYVMVWKYFNIIGYIKPSPAFCNIMY